ncbi:MAG: DNA polymerase III subunit delta [Deltaproteobacteria bacterium]|nr:DNA polymerase III subunit delta [Deltaproteobacteria bacterium]
MPRLTLSDLDKELRSKNLRSVYLIYGDEPYLVNTGLTRIKDYIAKINGPNSEPERFSGKNANPSEIVTSLKTLPMWSKHKLVIVSEADSIKQPDEFIRYFEKYSPASTVVFVAEKADARTKFIQACLEKGGAIECKALYDDKIPDWIRIEVSSREKSISIDACRIIAELVGNNLGEISSAIDKINLYIGKKNLIETNDVETVLTDTSRRNIFEFTEAVGERDLAKAMYLLKRLMQFNENEVAILSMLARHFRILLKAKDALGKAQGYNKFEISKAIGVNPFFVERYVSQSKRFSLTGLKSLFGKLYGADRMLKTSRLKKSAILERCVREIIL